jgi:hypothetical protein
VDFVDAADVGCSSEVDLAFKGDLNDFLSGLGHDFLDASVDNILLSGSLQQLLLVDVESSGLVNDVQQVILSLLFPLAGHAARVDMFEVLQPLEVAHCHSSGVA